MKPTLYLMMGYPGAGKTTIANIIGKLTGAVVLSSDALRMQLFSNPTFSKSEHEQLYAALDNKTKALLESGKSVVYDANLNRAEHRAEKYKICEATKAKPVLVWVRTKKEIAKQRAVHESRSHLVPRHETAGEMFERIANIIEVPEPHEPVIEISGEHITSETVAQTLGI